jgi:hypothetical protein
MRQTQEDTSMAKQLLTIIVNGVPSTVERNDNAPLGSVIGKALDDTNNSGQPQENWELRDANGSLLDLKKKIGAFSFPDDVKLYLSLKAGIGG